MAGRIAYFLALLTALAAPASAQEPVPQPPTIIPEERGPPVPSPNGGDGIRPVQPTLDRPVTHYEFKGTDQIDPGETSAESLFGQPVLGPDGRALGLLVDILLHGNEAQTAVIRPQDGDPAQEQTFTAAMSQLRPGEDGRSLKVRGDVGTGGMPPAPGATSVGGLLNNDAASRDGALVGQIHDVIMDEDFRVTHVIVRLAAPETDGDLFASIPYDRMERRIGTEIYLLDDELRWNLLEFRYPASR